MAASKPVSGRSLLPMLRSLLSTAFDPKWLQ
jgi:hypothetical protein